MISSFGFSRGSRSITIFRGAVIIIIGIVFIVLGIIDIIRINAKPIDLNDTHMDWTQLQNGQHVQMDIDVLIGQYMYTTDNGSEISRDYLMPHVVYDPHNDNYSIDRVIGVKVNRSSGNFDTAETIVANTVNWWLDKTGTVEYNTVTIHVDGYLQKMNSDQLKYAKEAMTAAGFTPHDLAAMIVPYYISDNSSSGRILLLCGAIFLLCGICVSVYGIKKRDPAGTGSL